MPSSSKTSRAQSDARAQFELGATRAGTDLRARTEVRHEETPINEEPRGDLGPSDEPSPRDEGATREGSAREGDVRWRQLLAGGSPREILCRIVQGDPLGMRDRVARRLHAEAYLLDADRVQLRALARCARFAGRYQGRPELAAWLDEIVDQAIEDLLREDVEVDVGRDSSAATPGAAFTALAAPLGLEPEAMQRACAAFNRLPAADRAAFFELVIHRRSLDDLARRSGESASEIARRARRALEVVLQVPTAPRSRSQTTADPAPEDTSRSSPPEGQP